METLHAVRPLARLGLLVAYLALALAVTILFALMPVNFKSIQSDWGVTDSYPAVESLLSSQVFAYTILFLRYFVVGVLLFTAGLLLWFKGRQGMPVFAALALTMLAITFNPDGFTETWPYPTPWNQVLAALSGIFGFSGIFLMVLFINLFPSGRLAGSWLRKVVLLTLALLGINILSLFSGLGGEWSWFALILLLLGATFLGVISLADRHRRAADPRLRQQLRPMLIASVLLTVSLLVIFFGSELFPASAAWSLVLLLINLVALMALPLGLLVSITRHQLWGIDLRPHRRAILISSSAAFILLLVTGISAVYWQGLVLDRSRARVDALLDRPAIPLIVDTDLGNDDVLALLYLMQHPAVDLQAITVVGTGLVHCQPGIRHVHGLLELTQSGEIPVSCGDEQPLDAEHPFPDAWRQGADRLWGLNLPINQRQPSPLPAPQLLVERLTNSPVPQVVLALGPLTNLAQAIQASPEVIGKIARLYIMGGAVEAPGNVYDPGLGFDNRTAEWNIYADPLAADIVFESGVPITLIPLDATNHVPVTMSLFQRLRGNLNTRAATFTYNIFYINQGWIQTGKYYLWDTLTAAVLTAEELARFQDYELVIVTESGPDFGRTLATSSGSPVRVATWADAPLFEEIFLRVLNGDRAR
jgi:pyrimidine-specific ribonucleoside hydrolase